LFYFSFNRTIFGIETDFKLASYSGAIKLLIAPFLELKHGEALAVGDLVDLLIAPFLELKPLSYDFI